MAATIAFTGWVTKKLRRVILVLFVSLSFTTVSVLVHSFSSTTKTTTPTTTTTTQSARTPRTVSLLSRMRRRPVFGANARHLFATNKNDDDDDDKNSDNFPIEEEQRALLNGKDDATAAKIKKARVAAANTTPELPESSTSLDLKWIRQQVHTWSQLAVPYYQESIEGRWLLAGVLVLTLMNSGVSVAFSFLSKDFWNALSARDVTEFYTVLQKFVVALAAGAPIVTYYKFQREQLAVHWRDWMTTRTVALYTQNRVYYQLEEQKRGGAGNTTSSSTSTTATTPMIDNPDQRISEDVNTFTSYSLQLTITLLTSIIDLVAFSVILYNIYWQLLVAVIVYAALGTTITTYLGQSLVGLNLWQLQREADLRYLLVRWRDNAESIAFYQGETLEGAAVQDQLSSVVSNRRTINTQQRNLEYFVNSYRYLVQILPIAVVAPQYFAGTIELGVISQSVGAFNHILNDLSLLINQFERLSSFSAGLERLSTFYQAMQEQHAQQQEQQPQTLQEMENTSKSRTPSTTPTSLLDLPTVTTWSNATATVAKDIPPNQDTIQFRSLSFYEDDLLAPSSSSSSSSRSSGGHHRDEGVILSVHNLTLYTPDRRRVLVRNLSIDVMEGQHLLIVGPSGAGKSSVLRALAGLWSSGQGTIVRPDNDDEVYFLPQRPYCLLGGSLKEQLLYPKRGGRRQQRRAMDEDDVVGGTNGAMTTTSLPNGGNDKHDDEENGSLLQDSREAETVGRPALSQQSAAGDDADSSSSSVVSDEELLVILKQVDLWNVAQRAGNGNATAGLYAVQDWTNVLSLGEQQRLAFGRLLVHEPRLVILGMSTSCAERRKIKKREKVSEFTVLYCSCFVLVVMFRAVGFGRTKQDFVIVVAF